MKSTDFVSDEKSTDAMDLAFNKTRRRQKDLADEIRFALTARR
jgi:hypothetical protein